MCLVDHTHGKLEETRQYASSINMREQLEAQLSYLDKFGLRESRCHLHTDFSPFSFCFTLEVLSKGGEWRHWFSGGLIFHGQHDGGGNGSAPTFSVNLQPTNGWTIHT